MMITDAFKVFLEGPKQVKNMPKWVEVPAFSYKDRDILFGRP